MHFIKRILFFLFAAFLGLSLWVGFTELSSLNSGQKLTPLKWLGTPPNNFEIQDIEGRFVTLLASKNHKIVILNFWASWCNPCLAEIPTLFSLAKDYPDEIAIFAISEDSSIAAIHTAIRAFPHMKGPSISIALDSEKSVMRRYGVTGVPETFIISGQGIILKHIVGAIDWSQPQVRADFEKWIKSAK